MPHTPLTLKSKQLVYYGPHRCADTQITRKRGNKGCDRFIVKAGNGAPANLEFDAPEGASPATYPNSLPGSKMKWKAHKCSKK